jgi:hypothetical protein
MSTTHLLGGTIAAGSIGIWVLAYRLALLVTRPDRPEPAPPTQDLDAEPPAVVGLLTGGRAPPGSPAR